MKGSWRYRKIVVVATLLHCLFIIGYLLFAGIGDSRLHDTLATYTLMLAAATLGGYVFGVVTDAKLNNASDETAVNEDTELGTWETRRRMIFISLFVCTIIADYLMIAGLDTPLNGTIASGICLLHAGILNSYVFGAVFDSNAIKDVL